MKLILTALAGLLISQGYGQLTTPDIIPANDGNITIQPIMHAALVLTWNGKTIYVDPYNGAEQYQSLAKPDLVVITDIHGDHMDLKTLQALDLSKAALVVPNAVAEQLPPALKNKSVVVANGESTDQQSIHIEAIPMYNLPEDSSSRHTKGRGNGYIITLGGKRIYISGDTEDIPEMRNLENIDIAFVCMNLPYTMDIDHAASAVLEFKPKIVYPYHFRGQGGFSDVAAFKKMVNEQDKNIDVRMKDWYGTSKK